MSLLYSYNGFDRFREYMTEDGKSDNTIEKYLRDIRHFLEFADLTGGSYQEKSTLMKYRKFLEDNFRPSSANSKISAINYFLTYKEQTQLHLKSLTVQNEIIRSEERFLTQEEYRRLLAAALKQNKLRLYLLMQTIASTGIRIGELPFVTVEALRQQQMIIHLKGKIRTVLLPSGLCRELLLYAEKRDLRTGPIFVTRNGKPLNRCNIVHEMKKLSEEAQVSVSKIFPHNLRHLFAVTYYETYKDLSHLADVLGHSNLNTTRIYTSISAQEHRRRIEALELFVQQSGRS